MSKCWGFDGGRGSRSGMMWVKVRFCSIIPEKVFTLSELNALCATNYLELVWYTFCRRENIPVIKT